MYLNKPPKPIMLGCWRNWTVIWDVFKQGTQISDLAWVAYSFENGRRSFINEYSVYLIEFFQVNLKLKSILAIEIQGLE